MGTDVCQIQSDRAPFGVEYQREEISSRQTGVTTIGNISGSLECASILKYSSVLPLQSSTMSQHCLRPLRTTTQLPQIGFSHLILFCFKFYLLNIYYILAIFHVYVSRVFFGMDGSLSNDMNQLERVHNQIKSPVSAQKHSISQVTGSNS